MTLHLTSKKPLAFGLILSLLLLVACGDLKSAVSSSSDDDGQKVSGKVIRVVDGDTVHVSVDGEDENVRLLLVDTPESVHPDKPTEPYGKKSSRFAKNKLPKGKKVKLEYDGKRHGKYGRTLAYIWVDGQNFNKLLLQKGFARYAYEYDPPYKHQDSFKKAQNKAEKHQRGIWSLDHYVEDNGFNLKISCRWAKNHHESTKGCEDIGSM